MLTSDAKRNIDSMKHETRVSICTVATSCTTIFPLSHLPNHIARTAEDPGPDHYMATFSPCSRLGQGFVFNHLLPSNKSQRG